MASSLSVMPPAGTQVSAEQLDQQAARQKGVAEIAEMIHVRPNHSPLHATTDGSRKQRLCSMWQTVCRVGCVAA